MDSELRVVTMENSKDLLEFEEANVEFEDGSSVENNETGERDSISDRMYSTQSY